MKTEFKVGTRKSALARWQTDWVLKELKEAFPQVEIEILPVVTRGDKILDSPLSRIGGKGLFTKELDVALLEGKIDFAVHSLKDLPTELPEGLELVAISRREDPRDALVSSHTSLKELPQASVVATGSLRRKAQLLYLRPDLEIVDLRGNVDTRLEKFDNSNWAGMILAAAGLKRLGYTHRIAQTLGPREMLPAVGQGCLGIVARKGDEETGRLLEAVHHEESGYAARAERAFLARLQGGCQVPIGALGQVEGEEMTLEGCISSLDGKTLLRGSVKGEVSRVHQVGEELAQSLLDQGGGKILEEIPRE